MHALVTYSEKKFFIRWVVWLGVIFPCCIVHFDVSNTNCGLTMPCGVKLRFLRCRDLLFLLVGEMIAGGVKVSLLAECSCQLVCVRPIMWLCPL